MTDVIDKSKPYFPLAGLASDGYSNDKAATATCFCGAVQLEVVSFSSLVYPAYTLNTHLILLLIQPTEGPGLVNTFVCNCSDCHKITASMFASNFTVSDAYLKHLRGRENLTSFSQSRTIGPDNGHTMTNYFCKTCGTLMYRVGSAWPDHSILRIGTVDDFTLHETKLKPQVEQYTRDRVSWLPGLDGVRQVDGTAFT